MIKEKYPQVQPKNEGKFEGRVFVKKAGMWLKYICFNKVNETDKFEWEI